ncbi:zinc finger protein 26-like [Schistocerca serialis cubense]|uniref:zinc finger protein 26-like n=1 Tax=Schistocerca serialis cubense TaxID=2023355 RepID=UPI00214E132B|nr:zinc finger protein 26-like [Schistocerca serialis cubense]
MEINSHVTESVEVTVLKQTNEEENVPSPLNLHNTVSCRENKTPEETQNGIDLLYCGTHNNNYASKRSDSYRLSRKYPNDTFSNGRTNFGSFVRPTKVQNRRKVSQHLTCNICGKYFATRPGLYLHRRKHKEGYQFECDTCSRKFMDKQTLKEHLLTHMIVKPYLCQTCGKHFSRHSRLKKHLMKHSLETVRPKHYFTCSFCEEVFISEEIALKHAKIGHGNVTELHFSHGLIDRVFLCEYCERCFVSHQALNCHRESHAPLYVFSCIVCRSTFPTFSRLQTHKIAHSSENATDGFEVPSYYACTACDKSYLHWTNLTVHWKLQHDKIKYMYHCKVNIKLCLIHNRVYYTFLMSNPIRPPPMSSHTATPVTPGLFPCQPQASALLSMLMMLMILVSEVAQELVTEFLTILSEAVEGLLVWLPRMDALAHLGVENRQQQVM